MYKISREQLKYMGDEIVYMTEIYNELLNEMELSDVDMHLKYFQLSLRLLNYKILQLSEEIKSQQKLNEL